MAASKMTLSLDVQDWVHLILAAILVLLVFIASLATEQHLTDAQFISSDVLKQSIEQLQSYAAESQMLATSARNTTALKSYTSTYSASLQKAVNSLAQKLQEHASDRSLEPQLSETIFIANQLSNRLENQITQPTQQLPKEAASQQFYNHLTDQLQSLDDSL